MRCYDWAGEVCESGRCVIGGFQSALERDVLRLLLPKDGARIILVLARGMWKSVPTEYRAALNEGRLLVVSPLPQGTVRVSRETAAIRNGWVLDHCESAVFASLDPEGTLARLVAERPLLRYRVLSDGC